MHFPIGDAMAYVRKKGNQVAIVHGERDSSTGEVVQQVLFTFFSKAEAHRAMGRGGKDHSRYFQNLLQDEHPTIKFNWKAITKGIADNIDVLPDLAQYREERLAANFKDSLHAFTRELVQADPQALLPSTKLLQEYKVQLDFLRDVIDMKLDLLNPEETEFNGNNEFYWRQAMRGYGINNDVEQMAAELYRAGKFDEALAAFELLTASFPNYAEGHNYLGLIHLELLDIDKAVECFRMTVELGRKLFPKRIRKEMYWSDHKTRPYIRGLRNLALALTRHGSFEEALTICEKLEDECSDKVTASCHRAAIYLNTGKLSQAEENALAVLDMSPMESVIAAFSQFEQGRLADARANFLFAALNNPLGTELVLTGHAQRPKEFLGDEDYNCGVEMRATIGPYLSKRAAKAKAFFAAVLANPEVAKLRNEVVTCAGNHSKINDPAKHSSNFKRWHELRHASFARNLANTITQEIQ